MSNLGLFFLIFIGILVIAGWISSEMISSKATRANKKSTLKSIKLEKENDQLIKSINKEKSRYKNLREEYEKAAEAQAQLKEFEREYQKLLKNYNAYTRGILSLIKMVSAKKYNANALSKDVLSHISEQCPTPEKMQEMKDESTREAFKRIKERMEKNSSNG